MIKHKATLFFLSVSLLTTLVMNLSVEKKKDQLSKIKLPVKCFISKSDSVLKCDRGKIQCPTIKNFTGEGTEQFSDFAISFVPNQEEVTLPELVKFYLYPRDQGEVYRNYTIQIGFKFHRFSIYYAEDMFDDGFRINNLTCYSSLVQYFRQNQEDQVIKVKEDGSNVEDIKVFGFLSEI